MNLELTITPELLEALQARAEQLGGERHFEHSVGMVARELLAKVLDKELKELRASNSKPHPKSDQGCSKPQPKAALGSDIRPSYNPLNLDRSTLETWRKEYDSLDWSSVVEDQRKMLDYTFEGERLRFAESVAASREQA